MKKITKSIQLQFLLFSLLFTFTLTAQVGIGTTAPTTDLDVNGSISLRDGGTIALGIGLNNNVVLPLNGGVLYSNYRITGGGTTSFTITGIVPVTGVDGQIVIIQNTTSRIMYISHNNTSSTAANRIFVSGENDLELTGRYSSVTLMYSDAQNRWVVQNKLSDETIYFTAPQTFAANTIYNLSYPIPASTSFSSISVNLIGDWSVATQPLNDITIHHIEARTGQVRFILVNSSATLSYIGMDFVISVRN